MSDVLGFDHPLTRACDALDAAVRQLLVVVALLAGSVAAAAEGAVWARSLALASAVVLIGTAGLAALRAQARRDRVLDLVIAGLEKPPLAVVQRQCRRLASARTRRGLARTFESIVAETLQRRWPVPLSGRPLLYAPLIAGSRDQLLAVAATLRSPDATVRGVALCERLVTIGDSPLYGRDLRALRTELQRACFLLAGD